MASAAAGSDILWWITVTLAGLCVVLGIVALLWPRLLGLRPMKAAGLLLLIVVCLITINEIARTAHQTWGWLIPLIIQLGLLLGLAGLYLVLRQRPQARGPVLACAMVAGGATTLSWLMWQLEEPELVIADRNHHIVTSVGNQAPSEAHPAGMAWTDLGHGVNLYTCSAELPWLRQEAATLEAGYAARVIRVAPYDRNYNCHGWTFSGGRFHVLGAAVERILEDNCYYEVKQPRQGDLIVYWDEDGVLMHTGVVRLTDGHGLVVIESKWDLLGRYLHAPDVQPYSANFSFYRTDRPSHILAGLEAPASE